MGDPATLTPAIEGSAHSAPRPPAPLPSPRLHLVLALSWLALVLYGSLVPFRFRLPQDLHAPADVLAWVGAVGAGPRWLESESPARLLRIPWCDLHADLLLNLLLYVPAGILLRLWARATLRRGLTQVLAAGTVVAAVAWLTECLQQLMPGRIGSINDVLANVVGGVVGATAAVPLHRLTRRAIFHVYCRAALPLHRLRGWLERRRRDPALLIALCLGNLALAGGWYFLNLQRGRFAGHTAVNWLPFREHFRHAYHKAFDQIGQSLLIYLLAALLLALQFFSLKERRGLTVMVLLLALGAAAQQVLRFTEAGRRADVTEPVLAVLAAGLVALTGVILQRAVRASCRRRRQLPVPRDRRRIRHDYSPTA